MFETSLICIKLWTFISNGTWKGKEIDNQIYYDPLMIFQRYKIMVFNPIHTPCGSFYYVCIQMYIKYC
jgi:hypothetical protein